MTDLDRIIADRDKALSLLREAVSPSGGDFCMCPELERRIEVFIADPLGEGNRLAALAGAEPVACGVVAENESVKVEAGFVYENGVHTPTVLVSFNPNDWAARDQFVAKVKAPHAPAKAREDDARRVLEWIASEDTGMSSEAIAYHMLGMYSEGSHPHDPADLGRCLRLLELFPEWKSRIGEMATYSRNWAALSARWEELAVIMDEEVGIDWSKGHNAPRTYEAMQAAMKRRPKNALATFAEGSE